jgi:hypothetical protein
LSGRLIVTTVTRSWVVLSINRTPVR